MGGGDKPLRLLAGRAILAHVLERLDAHPARAISANGPPERFAGFGLPVLADAVPGLGPLGGILAALDWAAGRGDGCVLTVPGDTPFVPRDLARRLGPAPAHAASGGRDHPPVAVWPVAGRDRLRARLARAGDPGGRSVRGFAAEIGARAVAFDDVPDPFADIDTPEDLARAEARLRGTGVVRAR